MFIHELADILDLGAARAKRHIERTGREPIADQAKIERRVANAITAMKGQSRGFGREFMSPSVMNHHQGANPVLAWAQEVLSAVKKRGHLDDKRLEFIYARAATYAQEFMEICREDIGKYRMLVPLARQAPIPEHALRPIDVAIGEAQNAIYIFQNYLEDLKKRA